MPILFTDSIQLQQQQQQNNHSSSSLLTPPPLPSSLTSPPHYDITVNDNSNNKLEDHYHHHQQKILFMEDSATATKKWQKRRSCIILPREEEGKEHLPPYECTVYKMGKVNVKIEFLMEGKKYKKRSWRRLYIELWGTMLRIYPMTWLSSSIGKEPLFVISLAGAEASRAFDYLKKPFVLRLTAHNGLQLLIHLTNHVDMISWIEHLQAGINISLDLEERPMPKFMTLPPRRDSQNNQFSTRTLELERRREQRRRNQQEILA
ncbi:hypothetical protein BJ944DRAFT_270433 [Cunninghamella echinulata]|nr:hypothetical protein BJ944DRAFT_270433 [Cunninghamella echinulata]